MSHAMPQRAGAPYRKVEFIEIKAGIYFRSIILNQWEGVEEHVHPESHATLVGSGEARLWVEGEWREDIPAGHAVEIEGGKKHFFQALLPDTRLVCIWREDVAEAMLKGT